VIVHNYYKVNLNLIVLHKCPGMSLDHQSMSGASRVRLSEREEECLTCYLMACDAGLLYLQELDKVCVCKVCRFTQNVFFCHRRVSHCILSISSLTDSNKKRHSIFTNTDFFLTLFRVSHISKCKNMFCVCAD